jgi:hypothetical protein
MAALAAAVSWGLATGSASGQLAVGFAQADITPQLPADSPVWLAGFYPGRAATGVHDPLYARTIVLHDGTKKWAWIAVDLIGLQLPDVQRLRARLPDFSYVLVASTHNHEGPDVIGAWGPSYVQRGVSDGYVDLVVARMEQAVLQADQNVRPARAAFGTAADESLLSDRRLPIVKDGVLRLLRFTDVHSDRVTGLVVQWNCHPETLGARNQQITADFPAAVIEALGRRYSCPVVYFTGAIGGLLAPPHDRICVEGGRCLEEGDFEFARCYGEEVARLAGRAVDAAQPLSLTPFDARALRMGVPMTNELYRWGRLLGVLRRDAYAWQGEGAALGEPLRVVAAAAATAIETEVGCLRLGELSVAAVPGELFPELVHGQVENPSQLGADYPDAPIEPSLTAMLPTDKWMLFGLANDEIGYIMPRRQWDRQPPYAYGRSVPQYGEINSCGPDVGPVIMHALRTCTLQLPPADR